MHGTNVLPLFASPTQKLFRAAVAKIIRDLKAREGLSNVELAEAIGCCADTISNAENENNDLSGVTIAKIGFRFGEKAVEPYTDLWTQRMEVPRSPAERLDDALREIEAVRRLMEAA